MSPPPDFTVAARCRGCGAYASIRPDETDRRCPHCGGELEQIGPRATGAGDE